MARRHPPEQFKAKPDQDPGFSGMREEQYSGFMDQRHPREQMQAKPEQDPGFSGMREGQSGFMARSNPPEQFQAKPDQDPGYSGYQHPYHAYNQPGYDYSRSRYQDLAPMRGSVFTAGHTDQEYFPEDATSARM